MKTQSLITYLVILAILCAGFVLGARMLGEQGLTSPGITFVVIQNQFAANLGLNLTMIPVAAFLFYRRELDVIPGFLAEKSERTPGNG